MIMRAAAGAVALLMAIAVVCTGVAYLGAAIDAALANELGVPGAAALTAFILLIIPLVWCGCAYRCRSCRRTCRFCRRSMILGLGSIMGC